MGNAIETENKNGNSGKLKKYAPLFVLILLFASFFLFGLDEYLTFKALSDNRDILLDFVSDNYVTALILYFLLYTIAIATSLPGGLLLTITGGFLFGLLVGGLVTVAAATAGATIVFLVAATSLGATLHEKAGPWLTKLEDGFKDNEMSYLLFLRLVPAFPFWLINIAPALLGVKLRTYVIGTFVGIIPGTFAFASIGEGLDSVILEQQAKFAACQNAGGQECALEFDIGSLVTKEILISLAALSVVALLPILIKRIRKNPA
ncbi:MAG: VTT domain-containing protein [Sneathiellales bacterium]|nr:VTT domain-containing protein [Sneathiellales bacterium]